MKNLAVVLSSTSLLSMSGLTANSEPAEDQMTTETCCWENRVPVYVDLQGTDCRPALSLDASFLYYFAEEDGLDLANGAGVVTSGTSAGNIIAIDNSKCLTQDFKYAPGLKVGIGALWEEWGLSLEYTWFSHTTTKRGNAPSIDPLLGSGVWVLNNWFQQTSISGQPIAATEIFSKWQLDVNLVDFVIKSPIYDSCCLSLVPFFGIRGDSICQHLRVNIDVSKNVITNLATPVAKSHNLSHSWGLGPLAGCSFYWFLPKNFRVEGSAMADLLFTQFSEVKHWENVASASSQPSELSVKLSNVNCLRPQMGFSLGLGWGTDLVDGKYYLDFAATYDFLYFWQQNMMRKLMDQTLVGTGAAAGDLSLQGLDIRASFYF